MKKIVLRGFVSSRHAHEHLLKHVLRIVQLDDLDSARDPERWADLIPAPILPPDVGRRRAWALAILERTPGCAVGQTGLTRESPCAACQNWRAIRVIDRKMRETLRCYVGVAQAALDAACDNPDRHGARLVAYRTPHGKVRLDAVDARHVRVGAFVAGATIDDGSVATLLTCYRTPGRSLASQWLELARMRAAHRRAGTLVDIA